MFKLCGGTQSNLGPVNWVVQNVNTKSENEGWVLYFEECVRDACLVLSSILSKSLPQSLTAKSNESPAVWYPYITPHWESKTDPLFEPSLQSAKQRLETCLPWRTRTAADSNVDHFFSFFLNIKLQRKSALLDLYVSEGQLHFKRRHHLWASQR